jgi:hypothetical protein
MPEQRLFHAPNLNMPHLSQALADWYRSQRFEVQLLEAPGGGMVLQARQEEAWRSVLGMSATLNILMRHQADGNLVVEIGAGKWFDKAAAAGVGMFVLWPMLLTAGYGAWQQSKLPQRTFEFIQNFIATGGSISADMAVMQAAQMEQARRVMGGMQTPAAPGMTPGMAPGMPAPQYAPPAAQYVAAPPVPPAVPTPIVPLSGEGVSAMAASPQEGIAPRFCSECGGKLSETAKFCSQCGTKVA